MEKIKAEARIYDIWCVNEDAEYHEAGDEGAQRVLVQPTPDQAVALESLRDVPTRVNNAKRAA